MPRSALLLLIGLASVAAAATDAHSPIKTWGWFGAYDSNGQTTIDWPTKLNMPLIVGGVDVQGSIVGTMHSRAATAGNVGQAVVFYLGFAGNDNACSCYEETVGDAWIAAHSTWQLKNGSGQYVYTSDASSGGRSPRVRAMNIGDTAYVNAWADEVIAEAGRHGWDGVLADYVFRCNSAYPFYHWSNTTLLCDGGTRNGLSCAADGDCTGGGICHAQWTTPVRTAGAGGTYTCTTYRDDMLAALKILKARLHGAGLVLVANHGGAYNDNCDGTHDFQDTRLQDQLAQLDYTQQEMCLYDGNGVAYSEACWIDQLKYGKYAVDHGVTYFCQGYLGQINNSTKRPYILSSALLVGNGLSGVGQLNGATNWDAATYELKLGDPLPCTWPGLQARRRQDDGDECIDGSGNIVACPGVQYRRRRDRTEECVTSTGTAVTRGCDGSNMVRRRHMDREPECVSSSGVVQTAPIPYECLDTNSNPITTGCPGTTGYTYRRRFRHGAVIVNPTTTSKTMYFSEPHGSGNYMETCVGPSTGGYADTFAGPAGEVCYYPAGASTTTTTTTLPAVGFGMVHDGCDSNFTSYPHYVKKIVPESYLSSGVTVNTGAWTSMVSDRDACGQTEMPVVCAAGNCLAAWTNADTATLGTFFHNFMVADPAYVSSGSYTPKVPAWEFGLEENLAARGDLCCTTAQTDSNSALFAKLSALQSAKTQVNGGSGFKIGYQLAETDSGALTDIETFLNSPSADKVDILSLHPYTWNNWPDPDSWFTSYMNSVDGYKAESGHSDLPVWFTEIGAPIISPVTEAYMARYIGKMTTLAFARGVAEVFWYHYQDSCSNTSDPECMFGLVSYGGTHREAYNTWLLLNQYLYGKHYVDTTSIGAYVKVYRFTGGGQTAMVAWLWDPTYATMAVTINTSQLPVTPTTIVDYQGGTITPSGGNFDIVVDPILMHD